MQTKCRCSITTPKPLFCIYRLFGLSSPVEVRASKRTAVLGDLYKVAFLSVLTAAEVRNWYTRFTEVYPGYYLTYGVMDSLETLALLVSLWSYFGCVSRKKQERLTEAILVAEGDLHLCKWGLPRFASFVRIEMYVVIGALMVLCLGSPILWHVVEGGKTRVFMFKWVQIFVSEIGSYQLYYINFYLKNFFRIVNDQLRGVTFNSVFTVHKKKQLDECRQQLNRLSNLNDKLCDCIEIINSTFGYPLLIRVSFTAVRIISLINTAVIVDPSVHSICVCFTWIVVTLGLWTLVVASCAYTTMAARDTMGISYKLLLSLPVRFREEEDELRQELKCLIGQVTSRNPHFTAADCFQIDFSAVLVTLSITTSYTVLILSMLKQ